MEFPYGTPFTETGDKMPKLHTKYYMYIKDDAHHALKSREGNPEGGLLCQDCHTTTSVHGNGNITGTTLANIEIECTDCHGTPTRYPWELPLGWGDEFGAELDRDKPRGLASKPLETQHIFNTWYPPEDGYLLTARGNPFGNVVLAGDKVIVHSASGLDFEVPTLKSLHLKNTWQNPDVMPATPRGPPSVMAAMSRLTIPERRRLQTGLPLGTGDFLMDILPNLKEMGVS
jgi:hypothetical protein